MRTAAADLLIQVLHNTQLGWDRRLESRDTALAAVRRTADHNPPDQLLLPTLHILMREHDPRDFPRIRTLAARPPASSAPDVQQFIHSIPR